MEFLNEVTLLLGLGVVLALLNIRNTFYMRDWWEKSDTVDPQYHERSWLLRALWTSAAATTLGVIYFLEITAISLVLGTQAQLRPISTLVLVILMMQFWRIGHEFRVRHRDAAAQARQAVLAAVHKKETPE